jgi:hypothetical protein
MKITGWQVTYSNEEHEREFCCNVLWRCRSDEPGIPPILADLAQLPGVKNLQWKPLSNGKH